MMDVYFVPITLLFNVDCGLWNCIAYCHLSLVTQCTVQQSEHEKDRRGKFEVCCPQTNLIQTGLTTTDVVGASKKKFFDGPYAYSTFLRIRTYSTSIPVSVSSADMVCSTCHHAELHSNKPDQIKPNQRSSSSQNVQHTNNMIYKTP